MNIELPDHLAKDLRRLCPPGIDPARLAVGLLVSKTAEVRLNHQGPDLVGFLAWCEENISEDQWMTVNRWAAAYIHARHKKGPSMVSRFGEASRGLWFVLTSYGLLMVPAALTGLALGRDAVPAAALALALQVVIWGDARFRWVPLRDRLREGRMAFQFPGPRCPHEAEWCSTCEPSLRDAISEQDHNVAVQGGGGR